MLVDEVPTKMMVKPMSPEHPGDLKFVNREQKQTKVLGHHVTCARVKSRYIGDGHPTFNRNPYNGYLNPYYWVDDHPLLYGNNGSLDPSTHHQTVRKPSQQFMEGTFSNQKITPLGKYIKIPSICSNGACPAIFCGSQISEISSTCG